MQFTKPYANADAAQLAQAHHAWLSDLDVPVPTLTGRVGRALTFAHVLGRHVQPDDLPAVARLLGAAHAAAYRVSLHEACLDQPFHLPGIRVVPAFTEGRGARIRHNLDTGRVISPGLTAEQAEDLIASSIEEPAAFYKDANPRNFLATDTGFVVVDFDDLTLAPFGYDLAKLLLTTAMTHGRLRQRLTDATLDAYNQVTPHPCSLTRLRQWMELHHLLTSPYLGLNGYTHSWHTLRPVTPRTPQ